MIEASSCLDSFLLALRHAFLIRAFLVAPRFVTLRLDVVVEHIKRFVDFLPQFFSVVGPTFVSNESSVPGAARVLQ